MSMTSMAMVSGSAVTEVTVRTAAAAALSMKCMSTVPLPNSWEKLTAAAGAGAVTAGAVRTSAGSRRGKG